MPKFDIILTEVVEYTLTVDAPNVETAEAVAMDQRAAGMRDIVSLDVKSSGPAVEGAEVDVTWQIGDSYVA